MEIFTVGRKRQALLAGATSLAVIVLLEAAVDLMVLASPQIAKIIATPWEPPVIPDSRLGSRPNPLFVGHDANGFRNAFIPPQAEIVAFGDSQTYGAGVSREAAWPSRLQSISGRPVYSIAFGGFGPVHTLLLWEDGLKLHPHTIIEALYTGNDLYDAFDMVYNRARLPSLKSTDPEVHWRIRKTEDTEPLAERVDRMIALCRPRVIEQAAETVPETTSFLKDALKKHSGLYGLARRAKFVVQDLASRQKPDPDAEWQTALALVKAHRESCQSFDDGTHRTIFTSEYRLNALNLEDIRIAEGARVILAAINEMHIRAKTMGVRFIVLEIPTKELVFYPRVGEPTEVYTRLIEQEQRFRQRLHRHLQATGIESIDALPALREVLSTGSSPYSITHDGHPNEYGHRAIASLVASRLSKGESMSALDAE